MTKLVSFIILIVLAGGVIFVLRTLRPRLHAKRMQRWEEAGLLPHQVDPYAPREDDAKDTDHKER